MTELIIDVSEFKRVEHRSSYNYNFYENIKVGYVLLEVCDEFANSLDYFLRDGNADIYIGNCSANGHSWDNNFSICFRGINT
jgi:hypothetical protein